MVSQPITSSLPKSTIQSIGFGLKGSPLHRTHYSSPSGGGSYHIYHSSNSGHSGYGQSDHGSGKSKKNGIALSALTLLAFLFFLNILQNCIEEQMDTATTSQVIVMTSRLQQLKEAQTRLAEANKLNSNDDSNERTFVELQKISENSNKNSFPNVTKKINNKNYNNN